MTPTIQLREDKGLDLTCKACQTTTHVDSEDELPDGWTQLIQAPPGGGLPITGPTYCPNHNPQNMHHSNKPI